LPTGNETPSDGFLAWRKFSQEIPVFPAGRIVSGGGGGEPRAPPGLPPRGAPVPPPRYPPGAPARPARPRRPPPAPRRPPPAGERRQRGRVERAARVRAAVADRVLRRRSRDARRGQAPAARDPGRRRAAARDDRRWWALPAGGSRRGARPGRDRLLPVKVRAL